MYSTSLEDINIVLCILVHHDIKKEPRKKHNICSTVQYLLIIGFDDNKVLKITKYWRTIGIPTYVQLCSIYLSWSKYIWKALEKDWEAYKTMVEDLLEGQPEVNFLRRSMSHRSWRVISTNYAKDIKHRFWLATWIRETHNLRKLLSYFVSCLYHSIW